MTARIFGLLLVSQAVLAAVDCSPNALKAHEIHNFPGEGYWMQTAGPCRITFTGVGGSDSSMYNRCTRQQEPITSGMDAFPVPGTNGALYVHPTGGAMEFYRMVDGIAQRDQAKPIYVDENLDGVYQSLGLLEERKKNLHIVRISVGWSNGIFQDYKVLKREDESYIFVRIHRNPRKVCGNLPNGHLEGEIPILSRDGQMISGREQRDGKTKIYRIDPVTHNCSEVAVVPRATSKVSFTFDNKYVLYKIQDPLTRNGRLIALNLETNQEMTLSGPDESVLYFSATEDGNILYTRRNTTGGSGGSELVVMSPSRFQNIGNSFLLEAIGHLWATKCGKALDKEYAIAVGIRLDPSNCNEILTDSNFEALKATVANYETVRREDLLSLCRTPKGFQKSEGAH